MAAAHPTAEGLALEQYYSARNMTDRMGGLAALVHYSSCADAAKALDHFYERSEEHTSELQSLMRISYAVFCLKKKKKHNKTTSITCINTHTNNRNTRKHIT